MSLRPASFEVTKSKSSPFTTQFIADKFGKDKFKPLPDIELRDIFLAENNSVIITAEEEYSTYNANGSTYSHDDILAAKFNDNGDVAWARNINKKQWTNRQQQAFIFYIINNGNDTYFFVNTGEKPK